MKIHGKLKLNRKLIISILFVLSGLGLGFRFLPIFWNVIGLKKMHWLDNSLVNLIIGAVVFYIISLIIMKPLERWLDWLENTLFKQGPVYVLFGTLGVVLGLAIAFIISTALFSTSLLLTNTIIPIALMLLLGYVGFKVGTSRTEEWRRLFANGIRHRKNLNGENSNFYHYKILDTNVLIDGRIYDVIKTGFIEGTLLIPNFVLQELQYIADSGDDLKRERGRRGLDILHKMQKEKLMPIEIYENDFPKITEVDDKLLELAEQMHAEIITNDFNLGKVSKVRNVKILNLNKLAGAMKPRFVPGEQIKHVYIVKSGNERQQGIGYLDDGTMVVVEEGKKHLNEYLDVEVTSALQTEAGRMIFANIKKE